MGEAVSGVGSVPEPHRQGDVLTLSSCLRVHAPARANRDDFGFGGRYVAAVAKPLPALSLSDWAVLAVVAEGETHGWPVVLALREDGALGQVWTVGRPIVYRSLSTLAALGLIEERGDVAGARGPRRTIVRATRSGHSALRRWLATPVEHVRDVRTELLLKLALLDRADRSARDLVERQVEQLEPVLRAVTERPSGDGFDLVLARWRREQALAVQRFLHSLIRERSGSDIRHRGATSR
jgi:PadR family transcriptional regulator AphA